MDNVSNQVTKSTFASGCDQQRQTWGYQPRPGHSPKDGMAKLCGKAVVQTGGCCCCSVAWSEQGVGRMGRRREAMANE
ncbi:hypothetical protein B0O80DRAFT_440433 [Mortierella sp. GBAus27b]|nr:hypothetical protein B0O80DRAFT_440433 [Mortierella sp. GBAus27b]